MLGHRTLNLDDYLFILKRRLWIVLVPAIVFPILAFAYSFTIPPQYLSTTLVLIDQQKVAENIVQPVINSDLEARVASMKEQIFSRSRLLPIIDRYNLYGNKGLTVDDRIELARKDIKIEPIRSQITRSSGLPGFNISYIYGDARMAQVVCGEIVSLFLSQDARSREDATAGTTDFLKSSLEEAKRSLDDQDAKLAEFQRNNFGKLPGEESTSVDMLSSLNTQLEAATQQLSRMESDKTFAETLLAQQTQQTAPTAYAPNSPAAQGGQPTAQQSADLQRLLSQEASLMSQYTADYPDVIAVRRNIADLRRQIAQNPAPITPTTASGAPVVRESPAVQALRAQIRGYESGIASKRAEQASIQRQLSVYQERISSSPAIQEQYKQLTRDYQTAQAFYDDLLSKKEHTDLASDLQKRQQGEQFRIMDQPNLPDGPFYPKRPIFITGGLGAGLAFGLLIVGILEYRDTALRSERDVWAFTKLPTLAIIALSLEDSPEGRRSMRFPRLRPASK